LPSNHSTWLSPSNARMCVAMRSRNQRSWLDRLERRSIQIRTRSSCANYRGSDGRRSTRLGCDMSTAPRLFRTAPLPTAFFVPPGFTASDWPAPVGDRPHPSEAKSRKQSAQTLTIDGDRYRQIHRNLVEREFDCSYGDEFEAGIFHAWEYAVCIALRGDTQCAKNYLFLNTRFLELSVRARHSPRDPCYPTTPIANDPPPTHQLFVVAPCFVIPAEGVDLTLGRHLRDGDEMPDPHNCA
jgi:hypothetical protein